MGLIMAFHTRIFLAYSPYQPLLLLMSLFPISLSVLPPSLLFSFCFPLPLSPFPSSSSLSLSC